jgi:hypothetical protein
MSVSTPTTTPLTLRPSSAAVRAALLTLGVLGGLPAVAAADPAVAALTQPTSVVEVGIGSTSSASAKAHEDDGIPRRSKLPMK